MSCNSSNTLNQLDVIKLMKGETPVTISGGMVDDEVMKFVMKNGHTFEFFHSLDCCESVSINEVIGDLQDLLNTPLLVAEMVSSKNYPAPNNADDSYTWTFYRFQSIKGSVTVRWLGMSNGYYGERVYLTHTQPDGSTETYSPYYDLED